MPPRKPKEEYCPVEPVVDSDGAYTARLVDGAKPGYTAQGVVVAQQYVEVSWRDPDANVHTKRFPRKTVSGEVRLTR